MKKFSPYYLVLASLLLWSCTSKQDDRFEVVGKIEGLPKEMVVYLDELGFDNQQKIVDSARSNDKGSFTLSSYRDKEQKLYRVRLGDNSSIKDIFLLNDATEIKIGGNWNNLEDEYTVKGSAGSASLRDLKHQLTSYVKRATEFHATLEQLRMQQGSDSIILAVQSDLKQLNENSLDFFLKYTDTTKFLPVAILSTIFTTNIDNGALLSDSVKMASVLASFEKRFASQPLVSTFKQMIVKTTQSSGKGLAKVKLNDQAPEFSLKDVNGKVVNLSNYKGKFVLIDFWAAWCPPCRKENPNVVSAYKMFKNKNFEILGVSLDEDDSKWKEAIAKDGLTWTQVSDLSGWKSSVVELYGIESIPSNFLLNPEGKIIAMGLTGENLHIKLAEVLK